MRPNFVHKARKRFGQNFLQDAFVIQQIISAIHPRLEDNLIEIGPGLGALTKRLLAYINHLDVIEIDRDLANQLTISLEHAQHLTIHVEDVLHFDFNIFKEKKIRIVGNLPYNITTPLIFHLLNFETFIQDMHFMLQKEVVDRLCAKPNSKDYGKLSIMTQYYCETEYLFSVPPSAFSPAPKVQSAFVRLTPRTFPVAISNPTVFQNITREAFNHRRKTLSNALKAYLVPQDFITLNLNSTLRPEDLSVTDFVNISNYIDQQLKNFIQDKF